MDIDDWYTNQCFAVTRRGVCDRNRRAVISAATRHEDERGKCINSVVSLLYVIGTSIEMDFHQNWKISIDQQITISFRGLLYDRIQRVSKCIGNKEGNLEFHRGGVYQDFGKFFFSRISSGLLTSIFDNIFQNLVDIIFDTFRRFPTVILIKKKKV